MLNDLMDLVPVQVTAAIQERYIMASVHEVYTNLNVVHTKVNCTVCEVTQKPVKRPKWR